MRIGLCSTDFTRPYPARELFRRIADMGYETVQLAFGSVEECGFTATPHIEIPELIPAEAISAIRAASREYALPIGAVNGTWNMAHPDQEIRAEGLKRFDGFLQAVTELKCPIVSLCSGTRSCLHLWRYDEATSREDAWRDMTEMMNAAVRLAEKHGVTLAIETETSNTVDSPEKARRILNEIHSPRLKMILDCANLFHKNEASSETIRPAIDRAFRYFGEDIVLAHGKDIRPSDGIDFCGAGFGVVDFPYMIESLRRVGFAGDMMLHGINGEANMRGCLAFMKACVHS